MQVMHMSGRPIGFVSDLSTADDAVGMCKGLMLRISPASTIIDISHDVAPFNVREAARYLHDAPEFYPEDTVFAGVVYPETGTVRSIAAKTARGQLFVGPDNGILTLVLDAESLIEAREVQNLNVMNMPPSPSFYGRDIVVTCAAHLAAGFPFKDVGQPVGSLERFAYKAAQTDESGRVLGEVSCVDKNYGNVWTNIPQRLASSAGLTTAERLHVRLNGSSLEVPLARTFSDVPLGCPVAYFNSRGRLAFGLNQGSLAARVGPVNGTSVEITGIGQAGDEALAVRDRVSRASDAANA